jgi:hypothetical protein
MAAGCQSAFVERPGAVLSTVGKQLQFVGRDMFEVADRLIERFIIESPPGPKLEPSWRH